MLQFHYKQKRKVVKMTTLTHTHTPHMESISSHGDFDFTFCESCENNIERFWVFDDFDRLPFHTDWVVSN